MILKALSLVYGMFAVFMVWAGYYFNRKIIMKVRPGGIRTIAIIGWSGVDAFAVVILASKANAPFIRHVDNPMFWGSIVVLWILQLVIAWVLSRRFAEEEASRIESENCKGDT